MKKLYAFVVACALLFTLGIPLASAEYPPVPVTAGNFAGESAEEFSPMGQITVVWIESVAASVDLTDGDISDWKALGLTPTVITENNMVSWMGGEAGVRDPGMPTAWGVSAFFVADPENLYVVFDVTDSDFTYGNGIPATYNGDALQLAIDFSEILENAQEEHPGLLSSPRPIFYSFSCSEDGAPLRIVRRESDNNGEIFEANGDGVKGSARRTDKGWSVELALSWQLLYDDCTWKAWADDIKIYERECARLRLSLEAARRIDKNLPLICMLHYPPLTDEKRDTEMTRLLKEFGVSHAVYGHLHGPSLYGAFRGVHDGVEYHQVSCDGLGFKLKAIYEF